MRVEEVEPEEKRPLHLLHPLDAAVDHRFREVLFAGIEELFETLLQPGPDAQMARRHRCPGGVSRFSEKLRPSAGLLALLGIDLFRS